MFNFLKRREPTVAVTATVRTISEEEIRRGADAHRAWMASLRGEDREVHRYVSRFNVGISRAYRVAGEMRQAGRNPSIHDVLWSIFNEDFPKLFAETQAGLARNTLFSMAELLTQEGRHEAALAQYLAVAFFDANGSRNIDPTARRMFPDIVGLPFQPASAFRAPGIIGRIAQAINSAEIGLDQARAMMLDVGSAHFNGNGHLGMTVSPEDAWRWIERDVEQAVASGTRRRGPRKPPPTLPESLHLPEYPG